MENVEISARRRATLLFALGLVAVGAAIWGVQWFLTQDGSAHLYNAHILLKLLQSDARFSQFYQVQWQPLPNWAGHLSLMALLSFLPARAVDRVMITLTFAGLACAIAWLRVRVAGWRGAAGAALLAVLLALNWMWLMGFYSFLLGACMFALTLGAWWVRRERFGWQAALAIAALLLIGYFCHLVSLGMTVIGLAVLALATPGAHWARRLGWTAAACLPLVPLAWLYRGIMRVGGGQAGPDWRYMSSMWSPREWLRRWSAVESLQLSGKRLLPFGSAESLWYVLLSPTFLIILALMLLLGATLAARWRAGDRRRMAVVWSGWWGDAQRGWWLLALLMLGGWLLAPDDFGPEHGSLLRQRLLLLALITLVPLLRFDLPTLPARLGVGLLAVACAVQIVWVWDYALLSNQAAREFMQAQAFVGSGQRLGTVLLPERNPADNTLTQANRGFRVRPLFHLDGLLGIGNGNVLWNNYEASFYLFPVQYRERAASIRARTFDQANGTALPDSFFASAPGAPPVAVQNYVDRWTQLLTREHNQIDLLVVWGEMPALEPMLRQWYGPEPIFASRNLRIFRARPTGAPGVQADPVRE